MSIHRKTLLGLGIPLLVLGLSVSLSFAQGSFDPRGFRLDSAPGGKPRFVPLEHALQEDGAVVISAAGDESWDRQFGSFNTNGDVYAIAVSETDVYVGGAFTQAGGNPANYIAKWNGSNWSGLFAGHVERARRLLSRFDDRGVGEDGLAG